MTGFIQEVCCNAERFESAAGKYAISCAKAADRADDTVLLHFSTMMGQLQRGIDGVGVGYQLPRQAFDGKSNFGKYSSLQACSANPLPIKSPGRDAASDAHYFICQATPDSSREQLTFEGKPFSDTQIRGNANTPHSTSKASSVTLAWPLADTEGAFREDMVAPRPKQQRRTSQQRRSGSRNRSSSSASSKPALRVRTPSRDSKSSPSKGKKPGQGVAKIGNSPPGTPKFVPVKAKQKSKPKPKAESRSPASRAQAASARNGIPRGRLPSQKKSGEASATAESACSIIRPRINGKTRYEAFRAERTHLIDGLAKQAFETMDRSGSGWLTRLVFLQNIKSPELRALLSTVFGKQLLDQPLEDLKEDFLYIWQYFDTCSLGEITQSQFMLNVAGVTSKVTPFVAESPRMPTAVRLRWSGFARNLRRRRASVQLYAPLANLKRLSQQFEEKLKQPKDSPEIPASRQFAAVSKQFAGFDWAMLEIADLLEVVTQVSKLKRILARTGGAEILWTMMSDVRGAVLERLEELDPEEFGAFIFALVPETPSSSSGLSEEDRQVQREMIVLLETRYREVPLIWLARVACRIADVSESMGCCDVVFSEYVARRCISEFYMTRGEISPEVKGVHGKDLVYLLWVLAQQSQNGDDSATNPFDLSQASRAIEGKITQTPSVLKNLTNGEFSKLCWFLRVLGEYQSPLAKYAGKEACRRAVKLQAKDLAYVVGGLTAVNEHPAQKTVLVEACLSADVRILTAREALYIARAASLWASRPANDLQHLWAALHWRCNTLTSKEVVFAAISITALGIRDDFLMRELRGRAIGTGLLGSTDAHSFLQALEEYSRRFPSEANLQSIGLLAMAAARRGNVAEASLRLGPLCSNNDRTDQLVYARREAWRAS